MGRFVVKLAKKMGLKTQINTLVGFSTFERNTKSLAISSFRYLLIFTTP